MRCAGPWASNLFVCTKRIRYRTYSYFSGRMSRKWKWTWCSGNGECYDRECELSARILADLQPSWTRFSMRVEKRRISFHTVCSSSSPKWNPIVRQFPVRNFSVRHCPVLQIQLFRNSVTWLCCCRVASWPSLELCSELCYIQTFMCLKLVLCRVQFLHVDYCHDRERGRKWVAMSTEIGIGIAIRGNEWMKMNISSRQ